VKARRCHESSDELLLVVVCKGVLDDKTLRAESRSDLAKCVVVCKFVLVKVGSGRETQKNISSFIRFSRSHPASHVTRFWAP
jgi:hypothetical protein